MIVYLIMNSTIGGITTFGIAAAEMIHDFPSVMESYPNLSPDIDAVSRLVDLCNRLQLDPIHLRDVVDDFLTSDMNK